MKMMILYVFIIAAGMISTVYCSNNHKCIGTYNDETCRKYFYFYTTVCEQIMKKIQTKKVTTL